MIHINEEFFSKDDALDWLRQYERRYHPAGYGTHLGLRAPDRHCQHWQVVGHRFASCD